MKTCFTNYDLKFSARAASAPPSRNPSYSVVSTNMCSSSSPSKWLACHNSLCWTLFQCMSLHRDTRREILYWMAYRVSIRCMNIFQWLSTERYLHIHISDSDILLCDTSLPSDASSSGHYMPLEHNCCSCPIFLVLHSSRQWCVLSLQTCCWLTLGIVLWKWRKNWRACPTITALHIALPIV